MDILIDTGPLIRLVIKSDPAHQSVRNAVRLIKLRGNNLITLTQNVAEFWNVCTPPLVARGGYGLSVEETHRKLRLLERLVEVGPDSAAAFREWKGLVTAHAVMGVKVHDARIVAVMKAYGMTHLLTMNKSDFVRYQGITAMEPGDVRWKVVRYPSPFRQKRLTHSGDIRPESIR